MLQQHKDLTTWWISFGDSKSLNALCITVRKDHYFLTLKKSRGPTDTEVIGQADTHQLGGGNAVTVTEATAPTHHCQWMTDNAREGEEDCSSLCCDSTFFPPRRIFAFWLKNCLTERPVGRPSG